MDTPTDGIFWRAPARGRKTSLPQCHQVQQLPHAPGYFCTRIEWAIEPIIAQVWEDRCISAQGKKCGICAKQALYGGPDHGRTGTAAQVWTASATAAAAAWRMPAQCHHPMHYTDAQVLAQIRALLAEKLRKDIRLPLPLVFLRAR